MVVVVKVVVVIVVRAGIADMITVVAEVIMVALASAANRVIKLRVCR